MGTSPFLDDNVFFKSNRISEYGNLMKAKKKMPVGTVSKGYKKVAEGKWQKISKGKEKASKQIEKETIASDKKEGKLKEKGKEASFESSNANKWASTGDAIKHTVSILKKRDKTNISEKEFVNAVEITMSVNNKWGHAKWKTEAKDFYNEKFKK